jgi:hypothetical protein
VPLLWAGHGGSGSSCHPWLVSQARSAVGWFSLARSAAALSKSPASNAAVFCRCTWRSCSVASAGPAGDGQADQPRLRICLLVPAGQQSQHLFPDLGIAGAPAGQHLSSDAVVLGEQAQQKVLGADVGGAGRNGPVSTAAASSFLNCPGVRCGTGWSSAWPERVVAVAGPLADLAAPVSPGLPGVPGPLQLPG